MDKKLFVVFVAIGAITIATLLQILMQNQKLGAVDKRTLWMVFGLGVLALVSFVAVAIKG